MSGASWVTTNEDEGWVCDDCQELTKEIFDVTYKGEEVKWCTLCLKYNWEEENGYNSGAGSPV